MRRYLQYVCTLIFFCATFIGCTTQKEDNSIYHFGLSSPNLSIPYTEGSTTVKYDIMYSNIYIDYSAIPIGITTDAEWIKNIDTTTLGTIVIDVEENNTDKERTAYITFTAQDTKPAELRLTQLGTPNDMSEHTVIHYFFGTSLNYHFKNNVRDAAIAIGEGALGNNGRYIYFRQQGQYEGYIAELHYSETDKCAVERLITYVAIEIDKPLEETIAQTLRQMATLAPANRYGLILGGHGTGWITREMLSSNATEFSAMPSSSQWTPAIGAEQTRTFGENNVKADIIELTNSIESSGVELDYILFDACLMSNIETLYDMRTTANYIISSPCEIVGKGFPYDHILKHLYANDGKQSDLVAAAEAYYLYYRDEYNDRNRSGSITVVDCSELEALADATRKIAKSATSDYDKNSLQSYEGQNPHTFYDIGGWATAVATDSAALQDFEAQLDRTTVARYTLSTFYSALGTYGNYPIDVDAYTGITTSAPCDQYFNEWRKTSWYKRVME